jgi:magnesium transporter
MIKQYYNHSRSKTLKILDSPKEGSWVVAVAPSDKELAKLVKTYSLDADLLQDGLDQNEVPRVEREGKATYIYLRYSAAADQAGTTVPILFVHTDEALITLSAVPFTGLEPFLQQKIAFFTTQRTKLLLLLISEVIMSYQSDQVRIAKRIRKIRTSLNKENLGNKDFLSMIDMEEDLNDFLAALTPMSAMLRVLVSGKFLRLFDDDKDLIDDIQLDIAEQLELAKSNLKTVINIREAYATIMANSLNRVFKLMTSITILMSIFTMVTGIYSMNIALPGAQDKEVFWFIVAITGFIITIVAVMFKRKNWF